MNEIKCATIGYNSIMEKNMDFLFAQAFATDPDFVRFFITNAKKSEEMKISCETVKVENVQLSMTENNLGESDITVKVNLDGVVYGLLIEDKIDAIAMDRQAERYTERGEIGKKNGEYDEFAVFIVCPKKYYESDEMARNYPGYISYEQCRDYFTAKGDAISNCWAMQLNQAIEKAKRPPQVILNEKVNSFFRDYKQYQEEHYSHLDLRTKETSNGYWAHYATRFGEIYLQHKINEGKVDLTFTKASSDLHIMESVASWLKRHGMEKVEAQQTGNASSLRISVTPMNMEEPFSKVEVEVVEESFKAIDSLVELANMFENVRLMDHSKRKKK